MQFAPGSRQMKAMLLGYIGTTSRQRRVPGSRGDDGLQATSVQMRKTVNETKISACLNSEITISVWHM